MSRLSWLGWVDSNYRNARVKVWCLTAWLQPNILGWNKGFEPLVFGTTIRRVNQLHQIHHVFFLERYLILNHNSSFVKDNSKKTIIIEVETTSIIIFLFKIVFVPVLNFRNRCSFFNCPYNNSCWWIICTCL